MINYAVPLDVQRYLYQILDRLPFNLQLDFWGDTAINVEPVDAVKPADSSPIILHIHHPSVLRALFLSQDPLTLADAYLQGLIDVEGDITAFLPLTQEYPHAKVDAMLSPFAWLKVWTIPCSSNPQSPQASWKQLQMRTRDRDRAAVQHHYDTGNAFYQLWLDQHMVYSCAYFEHPQMSLQEAQEAKLDRICRKLRLAADESLLDIGCGWGALMHWAVTHYGVKAHGITLSEEQFSYNQKRIADAGLGDRISVELLDYRDLPKTPMFDKIVSIGMVEHVGAENYPAYFQSALAALKPNGLFLNHGIATRDCWDKSTIGERFIDRYIFPDGHLTRLSTQLTAAEVAGWEVVDIDNWRSHYAKTLRCWAENFEAAFDQITNQIGERWAQLWRLYLTGCALSFEKNYMGIYQTLLRRNTDATWNLPLTRTNWLC